MLVVTTTCKHTASVSDTSAHDVKHRSQLTAILVFREINLTVMFSNDMIYLLTAIGLTPGGSSTVHIYTQTIHRTTKKITKNTQNNTKKTIHRTTQK
jgi:hypothetical protein